LPGAGPVIAAFVSPLRVQRWGRESWLVYEPLVYDSALIGRVEVPLGYTTDFASVPRWLPIAYATAGDSAHPAALVHDYLYQTHEAEKATADAVFLEAMAVSGEPRWRALAMYWAVRWCGQGSYDSGPSRYRVNPDFLRVPMLGATGEER
jgi:hypothetical protein